MSNKAVVLNGDCLQVLKELPDNSVDSLVTDPPAGISFMGKDWDSDKGGRDGWIAWMTDVMRECLRVLKPGAHGLVWSIPRTSHWTATALEDAGFEVRDSVFHVFGSGFPKSLDVSKAIDKAAGAERKVLGASPFANKGRTSTHNSMSGAGTDSKNESITAPATDDAKRWQGFGTSLKPAVEIWWLVRKPLAEKTVAKNVLRYGTGALNIDASRIDTNGEKVLIHDAGSSASGSLNWNVGDRKESSKEYRQASGRFPSHLVLSHSDHCADELCADDCAVAEMDRQSLAGGMHSAGGASRFFYVAKASKADKGASNVHPTVKSTKLMRYLCKLVTPPGGVVLDPFTGSGSTGVAALKEGFRFIGIEQELEYATIAEKRLESASA